MQGMNAKPDEAGLTVEVTDMHNNSTGPSM